LHLEHILYIQIINMAVKEMLYIVIGIQPFVRR